MGRAGAKLARLGSRAGRRGTVRERARGTDFIDALQARSVHAHGDPEALYRESSRRAAQAARAVLHPVPVASHVALDREIEPRTMLDPAVGPGIFPRLLRRACPTATVTALDVDPVALAAARATLGDDAPCASSSTTSSPGRIPAASMRPSPTRRICAITT